MENGEFPRVGRLLRSWRQRRKLSQLELALRADTSTRHLSCVETGRARPSRAMVLRLAEHLEVPLRDRNGLLVAAGYAPAYRESPLHGDGGDGDMAMVRSALTALLTGHEPYPAVVLDRCWNVVDHNRAMGLLLDGVPPRLRESGANAMRLILHPEGLASRCLNHPEVRAHTLGRLRHQADTTGDPELRALYEEVSAYPPPEGAEPEGAEASRAPHTEDPAGIVVPLRIRTPFGDLALFSMIATFGAPADVTLSELAVETFFPMDEATARVFRELSAAVPLP